MYRKSCTCEQIRQLKENRGHKRNYTYNKKETKFPGDKLGNLDEKILFYLHIL